MSERGIIFSAPMVRALLAGAKTQTRRLATSPLCRCVAGARLWVRETFDEVHPAAVKDGRFSLEGRAGIPGPPPVKYRVVYRADGDDISRVWACDEYPWRTTAGPRDAIDAKHPQICSRGADWTPSIHMPRWASRITLEVTAVRTEALQEITVEDERAEGVNVDGGDCYDALWDSLHGIGTPQSWAANPLVVVLTFRVVTP